MSEAGVLLFPSLVVGILIALALPVLRGERLRRQVAFVLAVVLGVIAMTLLAYVAFGEGYTNDGDTVWDVANAPRRVLLAVAVFFSLAASALATASLRRTALIGWMPAVMVCVGLLDYVALVSTLE